MGTGQNEDEEDADVDDVVDDIDEDNNNNSAEDSSSANREQSGSQGLLYVEASPRNRSQNSLPPVSPNEPQYEHTISFDMQRAEIPASSVVVSQRVTPRSSGNARVSNDLLLPQMPHSPSMLPNSWKEPGSPLYSQQSTLLNVGSGQPPPSPNARTTYGTSHGLPSSPRPNVMSFGRVQE